MILCTHASMFAPFERPFGDGTPFCNSCQPAFHKEATILNRRKGYRRAFANFDPVKVAEFTDRKLEKLLKDPGIIRNRLKIYGTRTNARLS